VNELEGLVSSVGLSVGPDPSDIGVSVATMSGGEVRIVAYRPRGGRALAAWSEAMQAVKRLIQVCEADGEPRLEVVNP
jgi:hypothetical protein